MGSVRIFINDGTGFREATEAWGWPVTQGFGRVWPLVISMATDFRTWLRELGS